MELEDIDFTQKVDHARELQATGGVIEEDEEIVRKFSFEKLKMFRVMLLYKSTFCSWIPIKVNSFPLNPC